MNLKYLIAQPWYLVYEGEEGEQGTDKGDDTTKTEDKVTFDEKQQAKVNNLLAEEKRKNQKVIEAQVKQLEELKKSKGLSEKEKENLSTRIEELENSVLTKEQLGAKEREKMANEHKRERETLVTERDNWRNLFTGTMVQRTILDEAVKAEAYSPSQIVTLLQQSTRLVEETDEAGNPVGTFTAKVKFPTTGTDGKPVVLDLTVGEAIKQMKDKTDDFGNLFKSGLQGGLGGSSGKGTSKGTKPPSDPVEYQKWRKENLKKK